MINKLILCIYMHKLCMSLHVWLYNYVVFLCEHVYVHDVHLIAVCNN